MLLKFSKMHGLGNDFMVVDCINQRFDPDAATVQKLADRHFGVGFDQLLLVEKGVDADFNYRIFNADGSEVEQCGNGVRCFAQFVRRQHLTDQERIRVRTKAGIVQPLIQNGVIRVDMGVPDFQASSCQLILPQADVYAFDYQNLPISFFAVSMGNPHAVVVVDDIQTADVNHIGSALGASGLFQNGVNVGFMQIIAPDHIRLRVYERGAGETLACGTGACAAVAAGIRQHLLDESVRVSLAGGDLQIDWKSQHASLYMSGTATTVYDGVIEINL